MTMRYSSLLWFTLLGVLQSTAALNIIAIATLGTTSHFIWTNALISRLVERGHKIIEVTVKESELHPNRTTFVIPEAMYSSDAIIELFNSKSGIGGSIREIATYYQTITSDAKLRLSSKAFQKLKSHLATTDEKIDLILIDYSNRDVLICLSHLVGHPPIVAMTPYNHPAEFNAMMGNLQFPSQVPHDIMPYSCEMSLPERTLNFVGYVVSRLFEVFYFEPNVDNLLREHFGSKAPTLSELQSNISVALVNTHPTTHCERPLQPSIVDVGFLHIAPPKSLPKDIQEFLDGATEGAIVISFGSFIRLDLFLPKFHDEIITIFGKMKQRFLWKTAHAPENLPTNVRAYTWLPQSDVLAHPNVRLLVAHGGTLSMQEAVYYGVPVVLIPFFLDQHGNADRIANFRAGRKLLTENLNAQTLQGEIQTVLDDPTYKTTMEKLSSIARDQPQSPLERAVFWVEFVARHQGAPHFQVKKRNMSWIQLYSIDVLGILLLGLTLATLLAIFLLRKLRTSVLEKEKIA